MVSASHVGLYILMLLPGASAEQAPVSLNMWAVHATQETRTEPHYDAQLAKIKNALADLPYNTFRAVKVSRQNLPMNEETRMDIDDKYYMVVKPIAREPDKRCRMDIRIEISPTLPDKTPVRALQSRMTLTPTKLVKLRGLKRDSGELVVVLAVD